MAGGDFVGGLRDGRVLLRKCASCGNVHFATVHFCAKCGSAESEEYSVPGRGRIATYTIITVAPDGFEQHVPYAWAVMEIEGTSLRISGFVAGIASPEDLPVGAAARIAGHDERGVLIERA